MATINRNPPMFFNNCLTVTGAEDHPGSGGCGARAEGGATR